MRLLALLLIVFCWYASAATYYVRIDGNNSNTGTANNAGGAWLTIGKAASTMAAGDTVHVQSGTYDERVALTVSGSSGNFINYVADGTVVCRGFDLTTVSYLRLIGFEITHTTTSYSYGFSFNNTSSYIEMLGNYIHHIKGGAMHHSGTMASHHLTMRNNTVYWTDYIPGVYTNASAYGLVSGQNGGFSLFEYNVIQRCGDVFIGSVGTNCIVRNNYCWDFQNSYWNADESLHSDIFQDGSDGTQLYSRNHIYERNFTSDCTETNSHFGIWQDTIGAGDTNSIIRGNIAYNFGSGGVGTKSSDKVVAYNNTFARLGTLSASGDGNAFIWYKDSGSSDYPIDGKAVNCIAYRCGNSNYNAFSVQVGATGTIATNNIGFQVKPQTGMVSTNDPLFVDFAAKNFRLQAGSPAIATGTNILWITDSDSSGTTFNVNDGQLLCDGWGMTAGDVVSTWGIVTRVTSISGNSVTVADSVTWTNLQPVFWGSDAFPEIGALPYESTELTSCVYYNSGTIYTAVPSGDTRFVIFYQDGIPHTQDYTAPYTATIASGTVTVKAFALYAQTIPFVDATAGVMGITNISRSIIGGRRLGL